MAPSPDRHTARQCPGLPAGIGPLHHLHPLLAVGPAVHRAILPALLRAGRKTLDENRRSMAHHPFAQKTYAGFLTSLDIIQNFPFLRVYLLPMTIACERLRRSHN